MTRRFFSGNTLDQAVMMAARHYGLEPEELAFRQIEKRHGFLRTRKAVVIAVDPESPRRQDDAPSSVPVAPAEPLAPVAVGTETERAPEAEAGGGEAERAPEPEAAAAVEASDERDPEPGAPAEEAPAPAADRWEPPAEAPAEPPSATGDTADDEPGAARVEHDDELLAAAERAARILLQFGGIDAQPAARSGDERVEVELEGTDTSVLVVENGKGLLAIQHLLPRMMRGLTGRSSFVRVDSEDFHHKRKERLQALALKEAEAVSRDGSPRTLPPMAPDERRIVHLAVQEIPTVMTESRGSGLHKRVVIRLDTADGGHDDIEARHGF